MRQKQRSVVLCLALALVFASAAAIAQEEMEIGRGRVMFASNDTIIVQVTEGSDPGMHKFSVFDANENHVKFVDRNGEEIIFADLRRDDILTAVRVTHTAESRTTVTESEVEQHVASAGAASGAAASSTGSSSGSGSASASASTSMPAQLPKTASPMPLVGLAALALLALAAGLHLARRVTA